MSSGDEQMDEAVDEDDEDDDEGGTVEADDEVEPAFGDDDAAEVDTRYFDK